MRTFMPAGMMFVCKGEGFHRFRLPVGRAAGMHEGMVMRLDLCLPVIGDAGNETRRSNCREPQGAQQHTIAYTLFHNHTYHCSDYTVLQVFKSINRE
jgi:hypothetical protein